MSNDPPSVEGVVIEALKQALAAAVRAYKVRSAGRDRALRKAALGSGQLAEWLIGWYATRGTEDDLFALRSGTAVRRVPFLTRPEWQGPGRIVLEFNDNWRSKAEITALPEQRRRIGYRIDNRDAYCLFEATHTGQLTTLRMGLCTYEQYVSTCGLLEDETLLACESRGATPLREHSARSVEVLTSCPLGAHAVGVQATVVFETQSGPLCLLQKRSDETVSHWGLSATLPAFAFQPSVGRPRDEFDLTHQFLREYGEEVLNLPELADSTGHLAPDWFYEQPDIAEFSAMLREGTASIQCSGFGFDAINGEPNLALLVHVRSPAYWERTRRRMHRSWEAERIFDEPIANAVRRVQHESRTWSPGAVFSLAMANDVLRQRS